MTLGICPTFHGEHAQIYCTIFRGADITNCGLSENGTLESNGLYIGYHRFRSFSWPFDLGYQRIILLVTASLHNISYLSDWFFASTKKWFYPIFMSGYHSIPICLVDIPNFIANLRHSALFLAGNTHPRLAQICTPC